MVLTAAKRAKAVRELTGLGREAFADLVGLGYNRLSTLEHDRARMSVEDLEAITNVLPEFTEWIIRGGKIEMSALEASSNDLCKVAANRIRRGVMPDGYGLELSIYYGD